MTQDLSALEAEMISWRRDFHAHPETAFEEIRTGDRVAELLDEWGIEVHRGLGGTGLVGVLKSGTSSRSVGLRADMDALFMDEKNEFAHRSVHAGRMHACGHDGHTAMLLGAAKQLAENPDFDGIVYFIFQPAEENEGGGRAMVEQGLFEKFPCDTVWGFHNWPQLPVGIVAVREGAMMAAYDRFEIKVGGRGAHGAMPHFAVDPIIVGTQIVNSLQTIVARNISPSDAAVISVTRFHSGSSDNVIPDDCILGGTTRSFAPAIRDLIERRMREIAEAIGAAHGAAIDFDYRRGYPPTINTAREAGVAASVAEAMIGADKVLRDFAPSTAAEDFSFMLEQRPGAYIWLGQSRGPDDAMVHNPHYDFNDDLLAFGARYWTELVKAQLPKGKEA